MNMNKLYPILLLLVLVSTSYAQSNNMVKNVIIEQMNTESILSETGQEVIVSYPINMMGNFQNFKCWSNFLVRTNLSSNEYTNPILMDRGSWATSSLIIGTSFTGVPEFSTNEKFYIHYMVDDNITLNTFDTLCPGSEFMITWYGSAPDLEHYGVPLPRVIISNEINGPGESILRLLREELNTSLNGEVYQCFNSSFSYNTTYDVYNGLNGLVCTNCTLKTIPAELGLTCGVGSLGPKYDVTKAMSLSAGYINQQYEAPPASFSWTFNSLIFAMKTQSIKDSGTIEYFISNGIYKGMKSLFTGINDMIEKYIPGPIIAVLRALQELINLVIVVISFYLMLEVAKKYVAFTSSLKSSLINSSIIFSQLVVWMIVLMLFLYTISNMVTFCGLKAGVTLFTLNTLGMGLKPPQSITDLPIIGYDLLVITAVGLISSDCTNYLNVKADTSNMAASLNVPGTYINLMDSDISILLRVDVVLIIIFIIIIILGILWNLIQWMRRKAEKMEDEVRTDRRNKEGYYSDEDEDEY